MSAYIPDQLDQMSKKELLQFAQTAHEENVRLVQQLAKANEQVKGLEKKLSRKAAAFNYIDKHASNMTRRLANVDEQLAKANERVKELESEKESFKLRISKQKESIGRYAKEAIEIAKAQEKFALEQNIEALIFILNRVEYLTRSAVIKLHIADHIEQLRKEQSK